MCGRVSARNEAQARFRLTRKRTKAVSVVQYMSHGDAKKTKESMVELTRTRFEPNRTVSTSIA